MGLTFEQRQRIRQAIHEKQKAIYLRELEGSLCAGCGCAYNTYSMGCSTCNERRRSKNRRPDGPRVPCSRCNRRTRSKYGICTPCQRETSFVASRAA